MDQLYKEQDLDLQYLQKVIVVNCGGTINMAGLRERKPSGAVRNEIDALQQEMKHFDIHIEFVDVFDRPPDSSNMGEREWETMYQIMAEIMERKRRIEQVRAERGLPAVAKGGIVVTHGTDTLQISSFVMSLKFSLREPSVPVVFTGSYAPISHPDGSDGRSNLRNSLLVAKERPGSDANLPPGVYVLIGQDIHLASRLAKVYSRPNSEGKYFISFPAPIGDVFINKREFQIKINRQYLARIRGERPILSEQVQEVHGWGIVEHIVVDYHSSPDVLRDFQRRVKIYEQTGKRIGLILQGDFSRNPVFDQFYQMLLELDMGGIITLVGSKKVFDAIAGRGAIARVGKIHKSLTHGRARVKLSWLLRFNLPDTRILELMNTNFVGDIFEIDELPQWIKYETLPDIIEGTEIVMVYPNIHHQVMEDAVHRVQRSGRRGRICLVGFGDGHIPAPNRSIAQVTEDFLQKEGLITEESFGCCENVEGVLRHLTEILHTLPREQVKVYLLQHYHLQEWELRSALCREMAEVRNQAEKEALRKDILLTLQEFEQKRSPELSIKEPGELAGLMEKHVKFTYQEELFQMEIAAMEGRGFSLLDIAVNRHPRLLARRLMKDALVTSHLLFDRIGGAIDQGIMVEIKTSVARAKTNTDLYEIGNMLKIIGVNSDEVPGWNTGYLIRR